MSFWAVVFLIPHCLSAEAFSKSLLLQTDSKCRGNHLALGRRDKISKSSRDSAQPLHFTFNVQLGWAHCRDDVQMEFGAGSLASSVYLVYFCVFVIFVYSVRVQESVREFSQSLMHERNPTVVISTQLCWQKLYKISLWVFRSVSFLYLTHGFVSFGRQDKSVLLLLWPHSSQRCHPLITLPGWHKGGGKT